MTDPAHRIRIFARLPRESEDWPPAAVETLWVQPLDDDRARIDNIPFFIRGVSLEDVVELKAATDGPTPLELGRVITWMGHQTVRVVGLEEGQTERARRELKALGCITELFGRLNLLAVDIPPNLDDKTVFAWLERQLDSGRIDFEEGNVRAR